MFPMKLTFRFRTMAAGAFLLAALAAPSVFSQSVTSSWSSGAVGGWENAANWSSGVPLQGTNVLIGISSNAVVTFSNPVSYAIGRLIMTNTVGGSGTNTLLINTNGFTTIGATLFNGRISISSGGVWTNGSGVAGSGSGNNSSTLTLNGGTYVQTNGSWGGSATANTPQLQVNGGQFLFSGTGSLQLNSLNMSNGLVRFISTSASRFLGTSRISGGVFSNMGGALAYFAAAATATLTNQGMIYTSGLILDGGTGPALSTFNMDGGTLQIFSNQFYIGATLSAVASNSLRKAFFNQTGGVVNMTNSAGMIIGNNDGGNQTGSTNRYSLSGGTMTIPKITLMGVNTTNGLNILQVSGGTLNLGSGGLITNTPGGNATYEIGLSGGTLGAQEAWSSVLNMGLTNTGVGAVAFRAEDTNGVAKDITLSGTLSGNGGLVKTGGGTLSLNGANTYSGDTAVSNGTLRINGTSSGTGMLSVFSNATLGGTGSLRSVTLAEGGRLAPGNSIGTLTVSNLTLSTGSLFDFELAATNASDQVVDLGTLSLAQLNFSNFTFTTNAGFGIGSYVLVDAFDHVGSFSMVTTNSFYGYQGTLLLGGLDGNDLLLTVALPIPEPTVLALLALGALLSLRRARRA